jgi:UDP-GlcNAc3NAcA epimerase
MKKIITVVGARPQFIKAAALNRVWRNDYAGKVQELIVHTGQHYDESMSEVFFREMEIDSPFQVFSAGSGTHGVQTGKMMIDLEDLILKESPDAVLVYGDTNSTLAGALVAAKANVPVIHVEAGLRSFQRTMPEEINRIVTDHLSTLLFSPTPLGLENLEKEGMTTAAAPFSPVNPGVFQCGDVMYDNALYYGTREYRPEVLPFVDSQFVLSTIHRDHNTDHPEVLKSIVETLMHLTQSAGLEWVLPVHPRLKKNLAAQPELLAALESAGHVHMIEPLGYIGMLQMERLSQLIVTDSGGVQKESYFAEKPCIILRDTTEWVEIVADGKAFLVGADSVKIVNAFAQVMQMTDLNWKPLYGDGNAAEKMAAIIYDFLK